MLQVGIPDVAVSYFLFQNWTATVICGSRFLFNKKPEPKPVSQLEFFIGGDGGIRKERERRIAKRSEASQKRFCILPLYS